MRRMDELGNDTGLKDKYGKTIQLGDKLSFDPKVWGGKHEFVVLFEDGELNIPSMDSVSEYCHIIEKWDSK